MGFGVDEHLDLLDLQAPVCIGDDVCDDNHFVVNGSPRHGLRLVGNL